MGQKSSQRVPSCRSPCASVPVPRAQARAVAPQPGAAQKPPPSPLPKSFHFPNCQTPARGALSFWAVPTRGSRRAPRFICATPGGRSAARHQATPLAQHASFSAGLGSAKRGEVCVSQGKSAEFGEINFCHLIKHFILPPSVVLVRAGTPLAAKGPCRTRVPQSSTFLPFAKFPTFLSE